MCGICGYIGDTRRPLRKAVEALRHRGPDDQGLWEGRLGAFAAGQGHARLSIIDLSPAGHQPMATEDGKLSLVFNGEIYNYRELRRELESLGQRFHTGSDTEVILLGYRAWGDDVVTHLRGMFAFALYDLAAERALLARDRLGIKPLYVRSGDGVLQFASELKGILALSSERPSLSLHALRDYLTYLYVAPPRSIFEGLGQLEPGHRLVFEKGRARTERYWSLPTPMRGGSEDRPRTVRELRALLEETVRLHLIADVPLGAFLSGGLDSTTLVALMARESGRPVKTFCMTFAAEAGLYDEREYARAVADHYQTDHTEIPVESNLVDLLPQAVRSFDEPFGNPTSLLVSLLAKRTREHVTVALAGDGGDEVFLGYPRYQGAAVSKLFRALPWTARAMAAKLAAHIPESVRGRHELRRAREFLEGNVLGPNEMYAAWVAYFTDAQQKELLSPDVWRATANLRPLDLLSERLTPGIDLVDQCQSLDLQTFLPNNLLTYSDRMSMAHGLEVRVPFCDHQLVEFMTRLPAAQKMPRLQTKALLREAVADLLPPAVKRRRKLGFNPPVGIWLKGPLRALAHDTLSAKACRERGIFDASAVQRLLDESESGARDRSLHVWALMNFEVWARAYLD